MRRGSRKTVRVGLGLLALLGVISYVCYLYLPSPAPEAAFTNQSHPKRGEVAGAPLPSSLPAGTYTDSMYGFSFSYPTGYRIESSDLYGGHVVAVENAAGTAGLQITVNPFDEPGPLTAARIKKDLPDLVMENARTEEIAGTQAVAFLSSGGSFGDSSEAWLVHNGVLYQISAYRGEGALFSTLVSSLSFAK